MIRLTWVVFVHAALISAESVAIELLTAGTGIGPLLLSAVSIPLAGGLLLAISFARPLRPLQASPSSIPSSLPPPRQPQGYKTAAGARVQETLAVFFRSWKYLLPASAFLAAGVFTWYDSVGRIGAAKEGLLAGPVETVAIVLLARVFLHERLGRVQAAGVGLALAGFFAAVASGGEVASPFDGGPPVLTLGDVEATISAVAFASAIVLVTRLTESHDLLGVTGSSLLASGLILAAVLPLAGNSPFTEAGWSGVTPIQVLLMVLFSFLPLSAALTYVAGLARIGASLTSTIASFSILITVVMQFVLLAFGVSVILPANLALAVAGGALGVFGIYLIHRNPEEAIRKKKKRA